MSEGEGGQPDMIPKARLDAVLAKLDTANARVGELEGELRTAQKQAKEATSSAASATALAERVQALEGELKGERKLREEDARITAAGFPDVDLVRFEHKRAGKDAGPLDEWLEGLKADRDKAPTSLRELIPEPKAEGDTEGEADTGKTTGGTANRDTGAKPSTHGGTGSKSTSGIKAKNEALAAIPYEHNTPEWREAAAAILNPNAGA